MTGTVRFGEAPPVGAQTLQPPAASSVPPGTEFTWLLYGAGATAILAAGSDVLVIGGVIPLVSSAGGYLHTADQYASVTLVSDGTSIWLAKSVIGTWDAG